MSTLSLFKPKKKTEIEYDKRARLMIQGYRENNAPLANNWVDLRDLDKELAEQGEQ